MLRLLVVDDDDAYASLVEFALEDLATITAAYTLREALALAPRDLDVVLCDLNLTDAHGEEVVSALANAFPHTTLIATSGIDAGNGERALRAGAQAFVVKGGELDGSLRDAVLVAAARTGARRAAAQAPEPSGAAGPTCAGAPEALAAIVPVALFGTDPAGRCTWTNPRFDELTGLTAGAALGMGWHDVVHPGDRRHVLETWHEHGALGTEFAVDVRIAQPGGTIRATRMTAAPTRDAAGRVGAWIVAVADETARRAHEREQAHSLAQLDSIIGASPNPIILKDPQDRLLLSNPACDALLGRPHEEIVGEEAAAFADPAQVDRLRALDREVISTGNARQDEIVATDREGVARTWLTARFPVRDADGVLTGVGVISSDITERRRLEREVVRQRELLEQAQEIAHLGTWEWDVAGGRMVASRQLATVLGVEADSPEAMLQAFEERIHPEDRADVLRAFKQSLETEESQDLTFRAVGHNGRAQILRARWRSRRIGDRTVLVGSTQDITQEHQREAARRAAEAQLRLVFDNAPIGLGLADLEGHWVRVNPAACSLLGRRSGELLGMSVSDVVHPEDREADAALLERLLAGELDSYEIEKRCLRPDGSRLWVVFSVSVVRGADGRAAQLVLQLLDMTVRRDLEARLSELADVDAVTGLPNRRRLQDELERAITWRRRSGEHATLLLLELDGLDRVVAAAGRTTGERILRDLGAALRRTVRRTDIVVRVDDERFALLLPDTTSTAAEAVVAKLDRAVETEGLPGPPLIGTVELASGSTTPDEILRRATDALDAVRARARTSEP